MKVFINNLENLINALARLVSIYIFKIFNSTDVRL